MSISCQTLLEDICDELHRDATDERFLRMFLRALNRSLDELSQKCNLGSHFTHVSRADGTVAIAADREWMITAGIRYHLALMGIRPSDPKLAALAFRDSKDAWDDALGMYDTEELNDKQATDTGIIGWGHVDS